MKSRDCTASVLPMYGLGSPVAGFSPHATSHPPDDEPWKCCQPAARLLLLVCYQTNYVNNSNSQRQKQEIVLTTIIFSPIPAMALLRSLLNALLALLNVLSSLKCQVK